MPAALLDRSRIGPNAVIQMARALADRDGESTAARVVRDATGRSLDALPEAMVDEHEVQRLMREVLTTLDPEAARAVCHEAGVRTADYLLAHRIPRVAQWLIRVLPRRIGLRVLLGAISRHAWTFAGSGRFHVAWRHPWPELVFAKCTLCRLVRTEAPVCNYYAGTFTRLLQALVSPQASVREIRCVATGDPTCRFRLQGLD